MDGVDAGIASPVEGVEGVVERAVPAVAGDQRAVRVVVRLEPCRGHALHESVCLSALTRQTVPGDHRLERDAVRLRDRAENILGLGHLAGLGERRKENVADHDVISEAQGVRDGEKVCGLLPLSAPLVRVHHRRAEHGVHLWRLVVMLALRRRRHQRAIARTVTARLAINLVQARRFAQDVALEGQKHALGLLPLALLPEPLDHQRVREFVRPVLRSQSPAAHLLEQPRRPRKLGVLDVRLCQDRVRPHVGIHLIPSHPVDKLLGPRPRAITRQRSDEGRAGDDIRPHAAVDHLVELPHGLLPVSPRAMRVNDRRVRMSRRLGALQLHIVPYFHRPVHPARVGRRLDGRRVHLHARPVWPVLHVAKNLQCPIDIPLPIQRLDQQRVYMRVHLLEGNGVARLLEHVQRVLKVPTDQRRLHHRRIRKQRKRDTVHPHPFVHLQRLLRVPPARAQPDDRPAQPLVHLVAPLHQPVEQQDRSLPGRAMLGHRRHNSVQRRVVFWSELAGREDRRELWVRGRVHQPGHVVREGDSRVARVMCVMCVSGRVFCCRARRRDGCRSRRHAAHRSNTRRVQPLPTRRRRRSVRARRARRWPPRACILYSIPIKNHMLGLGRCRRAQVGLPGRDWHHSLVFPWNPSLRSRRVVLLHVLLGRHFYLDNTRLLLAQIQVKKGCHLDPPLPKKAGSRRLLALSARGWATRPTPSSLRIITSLRYPAVSLL